MIRRPSAQGPGRDQGREWRESEGPDLNIPSVPGQTRNRTTGSIGTFAKPSANDRYLRLNAEQVGISARSGQMVARSVAVAPFVTHAVPKPTLSHRWVRAIRANRTSPVEHFFRLFLQFQDSHSIEALGLEVRSGECAGANRTLEKMPAQRADRPTSAQLSVSSACSTRLLDRS